jgi:hypothetical protein
MLAGYEWVSPVLGYLKVLGQLVETIDHPGYTVMNIFNPAQETFDLPND